LMKCDGLHRSPMYDGCGAKDALACDMSLRGVATPKQSRPQVWDCFVGLRPSSQ
jgi:hypothetical protein